MLRTFGQVRWVGVAMRQMPRWCAAVVLSVAAFALSWWVCQKLIRLDEGISLGVAGAVLAVVVAVASWWAAREHPAGAWRDLPPSRIQAGNRSTVTQVIADRASIVISGSAESGGTRVSGAGGRSVFPAERSGLGAGKERKGKTSYPSENARFAPPRASRNPHFTGREETLRQLEETLRPDEPTAVLQAVTGLGGVGKTELVIEYANRHRDRYDLIYTFHAATETTLLGDMRNLAGEIGLRRAWDGLSDRVLGWLRNQRNWLIIFDNADHLSTVAGYLPDGPGHVLITSRDQVWRQRAAVVQIDVWRPEESAQFFASRLGRHDSTEMKGAPQVAETLGHLPLAVEQAAAYMEATTTSYVNYLRLYSEHSSKLLDDNAPVGLGYEQTVATTWKITFKEIKRTHPAALELLQLCAYLSPDSVPSEIFLAGADLLPDGLRAVVPNEKAFNDTLGILERYGLIKQSPGFLSVHRLVQQVVRTSVNKQVGRERVGVCVRLLDEAFAKAAEADGSAAEAAQAALLPVALAVVPHAVAMDSEAETAQRLLTSAGEYMGLRAQLVGAQASLEDAVMIAEHVYGHDTPQMARSLVALGRVLRVKAALPAGRACFERALAVTEALYGPESHELIEPLNELAETLLKQGDVTGAQSYLRRAARLQQGKAYGR